MCGIVGYKGKFNPELIYKLVTESSIRGLHSFGYSYYSSNGMLVTNKFLDLEECLDSLLKVKPSLFIFHNRYSTSGIVDIENAQPITNDDTALVMNGVISGESKEFMESKYKIKMNTENDAEVLINNIDSIGAIEKVCDGKTIAAIWLNNNRLKFYRNDHRPLYKHSSGDFICLYSTFDIGKRSGIIGCEVESGIAFTI